MTRFSPNAVIALAVAALLAPWAGASFLTATSDDGEELSGGDTTVFDDSRDAFSIPARNLSADHRTQFFVGNSFFNQNWVAAPATPASRDGLGPLFAARSCSACHFKDGRGAPPENGELVETMAVRIDLPGRGPHKGPLPDPVYGAQLQIHALPGARPEAGVTVRYENIEGAFADGEKFTLRRPLFAVTNLGYGPLTNVVVSPLISPSVIGLGLLEAVP